MLVFTKFKWVAILEDLNKKWCKSCESSHFDKMFYIVEFVDGDFYELVPKAWLVQNVCLWPDFLGYSEAVKFVKEEKMPESNWKQCPVVIIDDAETYVEGRTKLKKLLTGDISTDASESPIVNDLSDYENEESENINDAHLNIRFFTETGVQTDNSNFSELTSPTSSRKPNCKGLLSVDCNEFLRQPFAESSDKFQRILEELHDIRNLVHKQTEWLEVLVKQMFSKRAGKFQRILEESQDIHTSVHKQTECLQMLVKELFSKSVVSSYSLTDEENALDNINSKFPMNSFEDVAALEAFVQNSKYKNALMSSLKKLCGITYGESTRRILRSLFSDELANHYCWIGKSRKKSFLNLRLSQIIIDVVCEHHDIESIHAENAIKTWLKYANTRLLYRKKNKE